MKECKSYANQPESPQNVPNRTLAQVQRNGGLSAKQTLGPPAAKVWSEPNPATVILCCACSLLQKCRVDENHHGVARREKRTLVQTAAWINRRNYKSRTRHHLAELTSVAASGKVTRIFGTREVIYSGVSHPKRKGRPEACPCNKYRAIHASAAMFLRPSS